MNQYFMHIANDHGVAVDETGSNYRDDEAAISEAQRTATTLLAEELGKGRPNVAIKLYVETADKHNVATISVSGTSSR